MLMSTGKDGGIMPFDAPTGYAKLDERVTNMGGRISTLEQNMVRGFAQVEHSIGVLSTSLQASQRTPWGVVFTALGVIVVMISALGSLAYLPVRENLSRLEQAQIDLTRTVRDTVDGLSDKYVTRLETERIADRAAEERAEFRRRFEILESTVFAPAWDSQPASPSYPR